MKKTNIISIILVVALAMVTLYGCGSSKPVDKSLTVHVREWWEMGSSEEDPVTYTPLKKGDEVYNGFSSVIKVKSVNEDKIVLAIDGILVEPEDDGTIDMSKEPLKSITLKSGESIKLVSLSMGAGVKLLIEFE